MSHSTRANSPPESVLLDARRRAERVGRSVYLFHDGHEWQVRSDIRGVPMSKGTIEVYPGVDSETRNHGGC